MRRFGESVCPPSTRKPCAGLAAAGPPHAAIVPSRRTKCPAPGAAALQSSTSSSSVKPAAVSIAATVSTAWKGEGEASTKRHNPSTCSSCASVCVIVCSVIAPVVPPTIAPL